MTQQKPFRELQPGEKTHPDYNKIIQLFEQITDLTHANEFTDNFTSDEWISIHGSWQGVGDCIRAKRDYIRRCEGEAKESFDPGRIVESLILNRHL